MSQHIAADPDQPVDQPRSHRRRGRVLLVGVVVAVLIGATVTAGSASVDPAAATPVSYTHLTLPTTPYV